MNTISKALLLCSLWLTGCGFIQGPWTFWPKNPARYSGIWVYAHVIAGWPLKNVCFEPTLPLSNATTDDFAFYDSASVHISGSFSGKDTNITLVMNKKLPNCFDGPSDLVAEINAAYKFDATVHWDSLGHNVTSHFTASAHTPQKFHISTAVAPAVANLEPLFRDPTWQDSIKKALGDSLYAIHANPAKWDTFLGQNQEAIFTATSPLLVPYKSGDTVDYLKPVNHLDFQSHYYVTSYSDDVRGVLFTQHYDVKHDSIGDNTFSYIGGTSKAPDSSDEWRAGSQNRVSFTQWQVLPGASSNLMDSIYHMSASFFIGWQRFYFYGVEQDYVDYESTSIESVDDPRTSPKTNIVGGMGIFAGMLVDSFDVNVRSLPGLLAYPIWRDQVLHCRKKGWDDDSLCRGLQQTFCVDSLSAAADCREPAIVTALESGLAWDAKMLSMSATPSVPGNGGGSCPYGKGLCITGDEFRAKGERDFCIRHNFPAEQTVCAQHYQSCQASRDSSECKTALWNYCQDQHWPIDSLAQCGTALVSWMRIDSVKSVAFTRVRNQWCTSHASDPQCAFK